MLLATINSSIVLIALPDIFKGIHINPLDSSNTSYLLWMMMGFLVVTAVLVVSFGRLGDMYGRARMYNMGFAVFTIASIFLAATWFDGSNAALWLIGWRVVQGVGGAFLMANSSAILTDVFPANQRGLALGINGVAAIAGSFLGLVLGGLLAPVDWNLIFLVSVPIGVLGTIWAYLKLHDTGVRQHAKMDWWGNITFAVGLIAILVAITYGIQPYGGKSMGWTNPWVFGSLIGGVVVLVAFLVIETRVANPLFNLALFKMRSFTFGNIANLMASLGRGGLQFILIIWLQGIWLPQHGYSFDRTPLWAGIYMLPLTIGFLVAAPAAGVISDRIGTRWFTTAGLAITALTFGLLIILPVNFNYWAFAAILVLNGVGMGLFAAPNRAEVMNSLPGNARGSGAGMMTTFQNAAMVLSIGIFFSLIIAGLSRNLPTAMDHGLVTHGLDAHSANQIAHLPAVAVLFAAFLGYNPIQQLLGTHVSSLPAGQAHFLTGRSFFPNLISGPFSDGLTVAFWFAIAACLIGAVASFLCGPAKKKIAAPLTVGEELASVAGDAGEIPTELVQPATPAALESVAGASTGSAGNGGSTNGGSASGFPRHAGTMLVGRVVDADGRAPKGGVVTVTSPSGSQAQRAAIGPDGQYSVSALAPGSYTLIVIAPGYTPQAVTATVSAGATARHDFRLAGAGVLAGQVRTAGTATGTPEATVVVTDAHGEVIAQTSTDTAGEFRMAGLLSGPITVTAQAPGHRPAIATVDIRQGSTVGTVLALVPVGSLAGVVTSPTGKGIPDVAVALIGVDGNIVATVTTDEAGRYELRDLPRGDYTIAANTYESGTAAVTIRDALNTTADVALGAATAVRSEEISSLRQG
ncbi:MAG TPA: MFS transporter [Mycobacteriales bacterium]|nr:MFS transporter [Mycobacteriales bacterium]